MEPTAASPGVKKILLVDDEADISSVFQQVLTEAGFDVSVANNGRSAFEKAKLQKFDLILLDQMMPDISGNEVLQMLKADLLTKTVPVAMLTNFSHDELIDQALGSGAVDYILKYTVSHEDLVKKVKDILRIQ